MKTLLLKMLLCIILISLFICHKTSAQYVVNGKEIDTSFTTSMNHVFINLDKTKIPFGLLRDYGMEFTNLENYNGVAIADSNMINQSIFRQIYTTLASSRITSSAYTTLPSPNTVDSLWYIARQPGQVTLCGLFYQYAYLASNADSTGKITVTNGQLFDKYVNGVWQNPYLQGQTVGFAPSTSLYTSLSFNIVLPANLWLTNSSALVNHIEIDAGDGAGYRTITPGTPLPVMYADSGMKTWNFKLFLTNSSVLRSHSQVRVNGNGFVGRPLVCFSPGCGPYTPPGGGTQIATQAMTNNTAPTDVISGSYPTYLFKTGETYNGSGAIGTVSMQYAPGHTSLVNPLIVVEGFDQGYYTMPESQTGVYSLTDFLSSLSLSTNNSNLSSIINSNYDIVFIDFRNGTDDIHRNALLVKSVIRWVNKYKPVGSKNVVLGLSMGGLCARYALKTMENAGETHNVSLFICHGTPQQGAEVPIGLQYMETHMNTLYFRAGVAKTYYDVYRLFSPSKPNFDGILNLSNTPAAEQMLITHLGSNFQIDNSIHNAWQTELAALGYPKQGNIRNVAISNGSECGQAQTLAQNGQIIYLDGKLSTSFWGDLIVTLCSYFTPVSPAIVTGQPPLLLGIIPGRNTISLHFQANAAIDGGGNQAYTGKISYTKTILWLVPVTVTLTNRSFNTPTGVFPYETFPGDFYSIPKNNSFSSSGKFGKYNITLNLAPSFGFVPTPSVLDIGKDSVTLVESDYYMSYSKASPPIAPKNTPFANFITAYSPPQTAANNNEEHISYETRNSDWLLNELKGTATIADCTALCQINTITGDDQNCNNTKPYSVPFYSNATYAWSVSSNLTIVGASNASTVQILPVNGTNNPQGVITVVIGSTTDPDCGNRTITKNITIGLEQLKVLATVDRTPQTSHYQYLTATVTQLGNTVPSNYNWYLEVNGQRTTLIATGLQLRNYPIAPCSTIYYRCEAATFCGLSIFHGYAYNTYCGTGSAISQSVIAYPNPASNTLTVTNYDIQASQTATDGSITTSNTAIPQSYKIELYNDKGKILKSASNGNGDPNIVIDTTDVPNGTFYLHIIKGGDVIEKQIVIQH